MVNTSHIYVFKCDVREFFFKGCCNSSVLFLILLDTQCNRILPGQTLHLDASFQLPPTLAPGSYALRAELADRSAARPATLLQSGPRDAQGRVMLGTATVTGGNLLFASGFE